MEGSGGITPLAHVKLQARSRLLRTACCPDKDLVAIVSVAGSERKMSLWKMQGSKKWEVTISTGNVDDDVVALTWSPDGERVCNMEMLRGLCLELQVSQ